MLVAVTIIELCRTSRRQHRAARRGAPEGRRCNPIVCCLSPRVFLRIGVQTGLRRVVFMARSVRCLQCARCVGDLSGGRREVAFDARPSRVCSGAELLLLLAAASTTAALLLLPAAMLHRLHRAVTKLDDALPHGLQHRCESRSSTPAPHLSNRPSHSASRRRLPLRGAPCTQLLPARQSQRQPVGVHAAGQTTNCGPTFRARAARSASPPRSGARRKNWALWGTGRTRFATEVDTKVFYGENLFCRQSRETCESGLGSRGSRSA